MLRGLKTRSPSYWRQWRCLRGRGILIDFVPVGQRQGPIGLTYNVHMHNISLRSDGQPRKAHTMKTAEERGRDPPDPGPQLVFGPVFPRRLGQSLGIDPVPPMTCNWNCRYCQLGRTAPLRSRRAEYVLSRDVIREVEGALSRVEEGAVDWVTFVGSGETLLHVGLGSMIRSTKDLADLPVRHGETFWVSRDAVFPPSRPSHS